MDRKRNIEEKLRVLNPHILEIIDNSAQHASHFNNPNNINGTHITINIASTELDNLTRLQQHKIINTLLKTEFANGLHALSIKIK